MSFLGQVRRRRQLTRSVFAVFVLALLQTALLPCAMAITGHATTAAEHSQNDVVTHADDQAHEMSHAVMSQHDDSHAALPDMPDCMYCPPAHLSSHAHATPDCLYPHDVRLDNNTAHQLQLDKLVLQPVFLPASVFSFALPPAQTAPLARQLLAPAALRPLTLTYCVQLK